MIKRAYLLEFSGTSLDFGKFSVMKVEGSLDLKEIRLKLTNLKIGYKF